MARKAQIQLPVTRRRRSVVTTALQNLLECSRLRGFQVGWAGLVIQPCRELVDLPILQGDKHERRRCVDVGNGTPLSRLSKQPLWPSYSKQALSKHVDFRRSVPFHFFYQNERSVRASPRLLVRPPPRSYRERRILPRNRQHSISYQTVTYDFHLALFGEGKLLGLDAVRSIWELDCSSKLTETEILQISAWRRGKKRILKWPG